MSPYFISMNVFCSLGQLNQNSDFDPGLALSLTTASRSSQGIREEPLSIVCGARSSFLSAFILPKDFSVPLAVSSTVCCCNGVIAFG